MKEKVVSHLVTNPRRSLFRENRNKRATSETIYCSLEKCPLRDKGTCTLKPLLDWTKCPYGRIERREGYTSCAQKFSEWITKEKNRFPEVPVLKNPLQKLEFVGDYVYLPYTHMDHCKKVPFLERSTLLSNGQCLIKKKNWTLKTVLALIDYQPEDFLGGTISDYKQETVPIFISHIREQDPEMWSELVKERPELNKTPDYVGRHALLQTLKPPLEWTCASYNGEYPVTWVWDGSYLYTNSMNAYQNTWGQCKLKTIELKAEPEDDTVIEIKDNNWVDEETIFRD